MGGSVGAGTAAIAGPGGVGAFKILNTQFRGPYSHHIAANQHCIEGPATNFRSGTGGLCTPEYVLENVTFDAAARSTGKKIQFGFSNGWWKTPIFNSPDNS